MMPSVDAVSCAAALPCGRVGGGTGTAGGGTGTAGVARDRGAESCVRSPRQGATAHHWKLESAFECGVAY